jgi:hypothetical protein
MALPLEERRKVVIAFRDEIINGEKIGRGTFDMTLSKIG